MPAHGAPGWWEACRPRATAAASSRSEAWAVIVGSGTVGQSGPQGLLAPGPAGQDGVGHGQHLRGRPVVLLQPDEPGAGKVTAEVDEKAGVGAGEAVDGLVVVAHDAEVAPVAQPEADEPELGRVHVLELVDEEVPVAPADDGGELRIVFESIGQPPQEIVEVDDTGGGSFRSRSARRGRRSPRLGGGWPARRRRRPPRSRRERSAGPWPIRSRRPPRRPRLPPKGRRRAAGRGSSTCAPAGRGRTHPGRSSGAGAAPGPGRGRCRTRPPGGHRAFRGGRRAHRPPSG